MESPKSRQHKVKRLSYRRREHKNKKFYNSKAWRDTREAYLRQYEKNLHNEILNGRYSAMDLNIQQVTHLLSLSYLPCETCLRLYIADAYDTMEKGVELDHIEPVNPENALERVRIVVGVNQFDGFDYSYTFGDPYSFDNLQLLCKRHHAKKSQRER